MTEYQLYTLLISAATAFGGAAAICYLTLWLDRATAGAAMVLRSKGSGYS